jgi:dipeptidyl aminopeptidase/acylaminoacyl peptidase
MANISAKDNSTKDNSDIFGSLPLISDLKISPDGLKIASLQNINGNYHIVVRELSKPKAKPTVFGLKSAKIRTINWGNNDRIIFNATIPYYSKADHEMFTMHRLGLLNIHNSETIWPFNKGKKKYYIGAPYLVNKLIREPDHVLISYYGDLLKVRLSDGDKDKVDTPWKSSAWVTNEAGEVVAYTLYNKKEDLYTEMVKSPSSESFITLKVVQMEKESNFDGNIQKVSQDRKSIFYIKRSNDDVVNLFKAKVQGQFLVEKRIVSENGKFDLGGVVLDYNNSQMIAAKFTKDLTEYDYFDANLKQVQADLTATFPQSEVKITSYSLNKNKFIAKISSKHFPLEYFFYDQNKGHLVKIADGYPEARNTSLGNVSQYNYTAGDGLAITGYFTKPTMNTDELPPLIVIPHGGPESRDDMSFYWLRQFFASEGYAVFQSNFRGSSGFGKKFATAGYGEWGKKMQQDIDDGVDSLIQNKLVDANRICVVGASYGGYVALYSATKKYDKYKCSVSFAGVSNLSDMFYHAKEQLGGISYWEKSIGARRDLDALRKYSPVRLVTKKTRPILILHGEKDTIVPIFQSEKMYKTLKKAKIKGVKYIELENEDHWFSEQKSRKIFLKESLKFIKEHI